MLKLLQTVEQIFDSCLGVSGDAELFIADHKFDRLGKQSFVNELTCAND